MGPPLFNKEAIMSPHGLPWSLKLYTGLVHVEERLIAAENSNGNSTAAANMGAREAANQDGAAGL